ncbi:hypothetical protein F511_04429 [Dorcoceras hygrometricum]|uniref:Uncharacterized protein n=1 Tax=Dorcoceras hygrometricum TaxID=472368 RepID=A0A2Z7D725_9LAMI|nr:hypothetical protein F511_04429 [Dorcoceras hygrometricum]
METSKVESVVRNQAEGKLNQLEHSKPAGTMTTSCKRLRAKRVARWSWNEKDQQEANANQQMKKNQQLRRCARYGISCDDISSDVITINIWQSADEKRTDGLSPAVARYQQVATVHPVESFSVIFNQSRMHSERCRLNNRKLQRFAYPVDMESSRKKADVVESYNPDARYPVAVFEDSAEVQSSRSDEPAAKQLTIYEELSKLDVNC